MQSKDSRKRTKQTKKRKKCFYNEQVHETFTTLVVSSAGGIGLEYSKFYSRFAELISEKKETKYCVAAT